VPADLRGESFGHAEAPRPVQERIVSSLVECGNAADDPVQHGAPVLQVPKHVRIHVLLAQRPGDMNDRTGAFLRTVRVMLGGLGHQRRGSVPAFSARRMSPNGDLAVSPWRMEGAPCKCSFANRAFLMFVRFAPGSAA
jgi:hypothetical protein